MDRRSFLEASALTAAAGAVLGKLNHLPGFVGTADAAELVAMPSDAAMQPLPWKADALKGLSEKMLTSHHDKNYATAVKKLNEIRKELATADATKSGGYWSLYGSLKSAELMARNSVLLHQLYFANLGGDGKAVGTVAKGVEQRFGTWANFEGQLRACAAACNGWVALVVDPLSKTLELTVTDLHLQGAIGAHPVFVVDMYEHAYAIDFGADKKAYMDALLPNANWSVAGARYDAALKAL